MYSTFLKLTTLLIGLPLTFIWGLTAQASEYYPNEEFREYIRDGRLIFEYRAMDGKLYSQDLGPQYERFIGTIPPDRLNEPRWESFSGTPRPYKTPKQRANEINQEFTTIVLRSHWEVFSFLLGSGKVVSGANAVITPFKQRLSKKSIFFGFMTGRYPEISAALFSEDFKNSRSIFPQLDSQENFLAQARQEKPEVDAYCAIGTSPAKICNSARRTYSRIDKFEEEHGEFRKKLLELRSLKKQANAKWNVNSALFTRGVANTLKFDVSGKNTVFPHPSFFRNGPNEGALLVNNPSAPSNPVSVETGLTGRYTYIDNDFENITHDRLVAPSLNFDSTTIANQTGTATIVADFDADTVDGVFRLSTNNCTYDPNCGGVRPHASIPSGSAQLVGTISENSIVGTFERHSTPYTEGTGDGFPFANTLQTFDGSFNSDFTNVTGTTRGSYSDSFTFLGDAYSATWTGEGSVDAPLDNVTITVSE